MIEIKTMENHVVYTVDWGQAWAFYMTGMPQGQGHLPGDQNWMAHSIHETLEFFLIQSDLI